MASAAMLAKWGHLLGEDIPEHLVPRAKAALTAAGKRTASTGRIIPSVRMAPPKSLSGVPRRKIGAAAIPQRPMARRIRPAGVRGLGNMGPEIRAVAPPGKSRFSLAKHGKYIAAGVVAAGTGGAIMRRTGPGADRTMGRPTGMYQY